MPKFKIFLMFGNDQFRMRLRYVMIFALMLGTSCSNEKSSSNPPPAAGTKNGAKSDLGADNNDLADSLGSQDNSQDNSPKKAKKKPVKDGSADNANAAPKKTAPPSSSTPKSAPAVPTSPPPTTPVSNPSTPTTGGAAPINPQLTQFACSSKMTPQQLLDFAALPAAPAGSMISAQQFADIKSSLAGTSVDQLTQFLATNCKAM